MKSRNNLLAKIHIGKKLLGFDDDLYRSYLDKHTGQRSTKKLSIKQLELIIVKMENDGAKFQPKRNSNKRLSPKTTGQEKDKQIPKIRAIWITMGKQGFIQDNSDSKLNIYCKRMVNVAAVNWLDANKAYRLLESLKQWHIRVMKQQLISSYQIDKSEFFEDDKPIGYTNICRLYQFTTDNKGME